MHHLTGLLLFCCLLSVTLCQDYQDVDSRPQSKLRTARGPIVPNRAGAKQAVTPKTSTTPEPEAEYDDVVYEDEEQLAAVTTTTSTEPPRKGIRGGVVRPFRSNTDLIEALKRRRAQASLGGSGSSNSGPASSTTTTEQSQPKSNNGRKNSKGSDRKFSRGGDRGAQSTSTEPSAEEPAQKSRIFAGRGRRF